MNQRENREIDLSAVKKILLIRLRRIGDNIMTSPAVAVLKENCPQASLTYIVEELSREVVEGNPHLDRVIVIPRNLSNRKFFKLIQQVRKENYDVLFDLFGGPKAAWLTLFSKAKLKIGYTLPYKSFIYDIRIPRGPEEGPVHSVENHVNLIKTLGIDVPSIPHLFVPDATAEEKEKILRFIKKNNFEGFKLITLHISAGSIFRDWGVENIVELIKLITQKPEMRVVLVGASQDQKRAEEIIQKSKTRIFSLVGELGLRELRELVSRSALFVGPDSGPMHIAASTDTPIVAYFGPTLPAHFSPWQAKAVLLEKDFECRMTCRQRKCLYDDFRCLQTITPEEVYKACMTFL